MTIDWMYETLGMMTIALQERIGPGRLSGYSGRVILRDAKRQLDDARTLLVKYETRTEKERERQNKIAEDPGRELHREGDVPF